MTAREEEENIIESLRCKSNELKERDKIKQLYGQARLWNRFHYHFAHVCTEERYRELNEIFKMIKRNAVSRLESSNSSEEKNG